MQNLIVSDDRMLVCHRVETVTHVVGLLKFVQDRIRMHGAALSSESKERTSGDLPWFRKLKEGSGIAPESNPPHKAPEIRVRQESSRDNPAITLAAPTTVSPTSATEQEHHQQNDQYGFHLFLLTTCRGSSTDLYNGRLASSLHNMIEVANTDVWSDWNTLGVGIARHVVQDCERFTL